MHDERQQLRCSKHFDGNRYELFAYVVMHNHVHVLVEPKENTHYKTLSTRGNLTLQIAYSAHSADKDRIWQDEYFDRIVRDEEEFLQKAQYILNNPWKTWPEIKEYQWVGFKEAGTEARPTVQQDRPWTLKSCHDRRRPI